MKYKIHKKRRDAVIMLFVLPVAFLPLAAICLGGFEYENMKMILFTGAVTGAVLTGWGIYLYTCLRPCAAVDGDKVIYYPLWKKKRIIDIGKIDKRTVFGRMDVDTWIYRSSGHTMTGKKDSYTYDYSYFIGKDEVMRISSVMINAEQFDRMIKSRLPSEEE